MAYIVMRLEVRPSVNVYIWGLCAYSLIFMWQFSFCKITTSTDWLMNFLGEGEGSVH
jgi:hypothetical protein